MIAAARGGYDLSHDLTTGGPVRDVAFVIVGIVVLLAFIVAARLIAHLAGQQLLKRHVRGDMVVLGRRVVTALVIVIGVFAALGFAVENANVPLFGLLLATVVAALGVQDLLRDYVSGYYVLLERHIRVGDRISFDGDEGLITDVRLRVTLLRNDQGDLVVVPNSELFTKSVTIRARGEATTAPPT
jgi:small conductance mechanosensitive channel